MRSYIHDGQGHAQNSITGCLEAYDTHHSAPTTLCVRRFCHQLGKCPANKELAPGSSFNLKAFKINCGCRRA